MRIWNTVHRNCEVALTAHTNSVTSVKWGGDGLIYTASRDTTVMVWDGTEGKECGKVVRQLKGHGHWVNTLALSSEYVVRTGPFDHKAVKPESDADAKAKALERYKQATQGKPERLVSGSDDFTMFMWTPATSKTPVARMTGHVQLINHVLFSPDGRFVASGDGDGKLFFWDWKKCRIFKRLKAHDKVTIGCEWHPLETSKVATCSWDGTIKYWD